MHQQQSAFENIEEKGRSACNEQFLLFPQCFPKSDNCIPICTYFYIISSFAAEFQEPQSGREGFKVICHILHSHSDKPHLLMSRSSVKVKYKGKTFKTGICIGIDVIQIHRVCTDPFYIFNM